MNEEEGRQDSSSSPFETTPHFGEHLSARARPREIIYLRPDDSVDEAHALFATSDRRHVPVLSGSTLVGVLSTMTVLRSLQAPRPRCASRGRGWWWWWCCCAALAPTAARRVPRDRSAGRATWASDGRSGSTDRVAWYGCVARRRRGAAGASACRVCLSPAALRLRAPVFAGASPTTRRAARRRFASSRR